MSLSQTDAQAQAELRARQGAGARYDAEGAPHDALLLARRGTAFFSRQLNFLDDEKLDEETPDGNGLRRRIVAEVSYQARFLARALEDRANAPTIMVADEYVGEVDRAVTLPTRALRALFHHSEVHLNVVWRDLTDDDWTQSMQDFNAGSASLTDLVKGRSDVVWGAAQSIAIHFSASDIPAGLTTNWPQHVPR